MRPPWAASVTTAFALLALSSSFASAATRAVDEARAEAEALQTTGRAHEARTTGDKAEELEQAIASYERALALILRDQSPDLWISLQIDVGAAYGGRIRGNRAENVERSIAAYGAALLEADRRRDPSNWARVQNNLGIAYDNRIEGNREANLAAAVAAYRAALSVTRRDRDPRLWSNLHNNLGVAYSHRSHEHPREAELAIQSFGLALQVRSGSARGATLNNLGEVYLRRVAGDLLEARLGDDAPEVVFLAACESGLSDIARDDELVGLPTALIEAGARGVVSALWPVREEATAFLAAKFGEFVQGGQPPSDALREAQKWLREATVTDLLDYLARLVGALPPWSDAAKAYSHFEDALGADLEAKPYADAYFWGGFSFTGTDDVQPRSTGSRRVEPPL